MLRALNLLGVAIFTASATLQILSGDYHWGSVYVVAAAVEAGFAVWSRDDWASW